MPGVDLVVPTDADAVHQLQGAPPEQGFEQLEFPAAVHSMHDPSSRASAGGPCPSHASNLLHVCLLYGMQYCTGSPAIPHVHDHVDLILWRGMAFQPGCNVNDLQDLPILDSLKVHGWALGPDIGTERTSGTPCD